jgi:hypothetical protein
MKAYPSFDGVYVWRHVNLTDCIKLEYYGSKAKYQNQGKMGKIYKMMPIYFYVHYECINEVCYFWTYR